jgi:hypothetical protein
MYSLLFAAHDRAGNAVSRSVTVVIDTLRPTIVFSSPPTTVPASGADIQAILSDETSGIALSSIQGTLNGQDISGLLNISVSSFTPSGTPATVTVTATVTPFDGANHLVLSTNDLAQNQASNSVDFSTSTSTFTPEVVLVPRATIDIVAVTQPPNAGEQDPNYYGQSFRPLLLKVRAKIGGVPQQGILINPKITSGNGQVFFTNDYPQRTNASGEAGFGFIATKVGSAVVDVVSAVGDPGQAAHFPIQSAPLAPVIPFVILAYPGSAFVAPLEAGYPGRVTVYLDEVDDQGNPVTDESLQKLMFFNTVYTTRDDGRLHFPFQVKSNAQAGNANIRATFPEFRDQTGQLVTTETSIDVLDQSQVTATTAITSGNAQTIYPNKPLDKEIVISTSVPQDQHTVIQLEVSGPGKIQSTSGSTITATPDGKTVLVETFDNTASFKYTAEPDQTEPATLLTAALSTFQPPSPGLVLNIDALAQHGVVLPPRIEIIANVDSQEIGSLPDTDLTEILTQTIASNRYFHLELTIPASQVSGNTTTVTLAALNERGESPAADQLYPPATQDITVTRQGQTDKFTSGPLIGTSQARSILTTASFPFTLFRLGAFTSGTLQVGAATIFLQEDPIIRPTTIPEITHREGRIAGLGRPGDQEVLVNDRLNMVVGAPGGAAPVVINLNVVPPRNRDSNTPNLTIHAQQDFNPIGLFLADSQELQTFDLPLDNANTIAFQPTGTGGNPLWMSTDLTFKLNGLRGNLPDSMVTGKVRAKTAKYCGNLRIAYHYLLTPGEVFRNNVQGTKMDELHSLAEAILAQAGILLTDCAILELHSYISLINPPAVALNYPAAVPNNAQNLQDRTDAYNYYDTQSKASRTLPGTHPNVSIFFIDTVDSTTAEVGGRTFRIGNVLDPATKRTFAIVTRGAFRDLANQANQAHEMGHMLGLNDTFVPALGDDDPTVIEFDNLMMNQPPRRRMNGLTFAIRIGAAGGSTQIQAQIINLVGPFLTSP